MAKTVTAARKTGAAVGTTAFAGFAQRVFTLSVATCVANITIGAVPFVDTFAVAGFGGIKGNRISSAIPAGAVAGAVISTLTAVKTPVEFLTVEVGQETVLSGVTQTLE